MHDNVCDAEAEAEADTDTGGGTSNAAKVHKHLTSGGAVITCVPIPSCWECTAGVMNDNSKAVQRWRNEAMEHCSSGSWKH